MSETTIITNENPDEGEGVLAEAAVASATMSGIAVATAEAANEEAQEAEDLAVYAHETAEAAIEVASSRPDHETVNRMIDEKLGGLVDALMARLATPAHTEVEVEVVEDEVPDEVKPRSIEKTTKKKKSFADRYRGLVDED
jgi:hypothetical protein